MFRSLSVAVVLLLAQPTTAAALPPEAVELARRAKAAEEAGKYAVAADMYDEASSEYAAENPTRNDAPYAFAVAVNALRLGEYERAADRLAICARAKSMSGREVAATIVTAARRLAKAPQDVDARIEFARMFWVDGSHRTRSHRDAIAMITPALDFGPTPAQRRKILRDLIEYSLAAGDDPEVVEGHALTLLNESPGQKETADAASAVSAVYARRKQYVEAQDWLTPLIQDVYADKVRLRARLTMADLCRAIGDETAMLRHLEAVAGDMASVLAGRYLMDTRDSRQLALVQLGEHFQSTKEYDRALTYYRAWQPVSWCGNCAVSLANEREKRIRDCLASLAKPTTRGTHARRNAEGS